MTVAEPAWAGSSSQPRTRRTVAWWLDPPLAPPARALLAVALVAGAFTFDVLTDDEVSASLVYMVAILVGSWLTGRRVGTALAMLGTVAWLVAHQLTGTPFTHPVVLVWNLVTELGLYLVVAWAITEVRRGLERAHRLAARLELARRSLERETRAVGELQREMLPPAPPALAGFEWRIVYEPSTRAGGDYYDFFALDGGRVGVLIADASGHGASAAVLMAMTRVLLHTAPEPLEPPERVLARLDRRLAHVLPASWFVTACYLVLDPASGRFAYSLAGHDAPLVLRAGGALEHLPLAGGPPLGPRLGLGYDAGSGALGIGDTLVLRTDGLTEAMDPGRALFGETGLGLALAGAERLPVAALAARVLERVETHRAGGAPSDDLTLILLRRAG